MNNRNITSLNIILATLVVAGIGIFMLFSFDLALSSEPLFEDQTSSRAWCGTNSIPEGLSAEFELGKNLFRVNCKQCHNSNMVDDLTGPALGGVVDRWGDYPKEDLYNWIRNSSKLIADNHPRAVEINNEWNSAMNAFPFLTDTEIDAILVYIGSKE